KMPCCVVEYVQDTYVRVDYAVCLTFLLVHGARFAFVVACQASTRAACAIRAGQRHSLCTNPSRTITPCSRYVTWSCHIQTSEQAVVAVRRRVRVRHRVLPWRCHVSCRSRARAMECSVPSGRKCCDQCVSSVIT